MGHTISEMDPVGTVNRQNRLQREINLRKSLEDIPSAEFTMKEISVLSLFMDVPSHRSLTDQQLVYFELKVKRIMGEKNS